VDLTGYTTKPGTPAVTHTEWYWTQTWWTWSDTAPTDWVSPLPAGTWSRDGWSWSHFAYGWTFTTSAHSVHAPRDVGIFHGRILGSGWDKGDSVTVTDTPAVDPNPSPNTVTISVDGTQVVNTTFGTSYSWSQQLSVADSHSLQVSATAWNGTPVAVNFDQTKDCTTTIPVPDAPQPTAPTCSTPGALFIPADTDQINWSAVGNSSVKAHAKTGYKFADGKKNEKFDETVLPQLTGAQCTRVPMVPTFTESTCVDHQPTAPTVSLPANGDHITYSWWFPTNDNGFQIKATLDAGYSWGSLTAPWQDKGTDSNGDAVAAYHHTWAAKPDCNVYVTPDVPQLSETCEVDGNGHQTGNVLDDFTVPADTANVHYAERDGKLYAVIQQSVKAYTFFLKELPDGWAFYDGSKHQYLVFTPTYTNPTCLIDTAPVAPTVTQAVCNGPGTHTTATVVDADGNGVTYTVANDLSTVTATLQSGYQWQKDLPAGWAAGREGTLVYTVPLTSPGDCLVSVAPRAVTAAAGTCDAGTGFDSPASITSPTDGLDEGGITYHVAGLTVTATPDAGYEIPPTQGWVNASGIWTYTASVTQPFCPSVIALPGSVPGTPDGSLDGVPGTTNPGQQLNVTGTGFAPGATVNFGIYSTPLLLATATADASGTATATIVIPADFTGDHTVVAAGTTPSGAPAFLAAKTTVVAKSAPTPAGSGSHGVGGVSTSRGPGVGPNGASSRGLANTGARVNPVALTQLGLLALLVGGGLLVATRRRARKH